MQTIQRSASWVRKSRVQIAKALAKSIEWEQASWQEACTTVAQFVDKLGKPIDHGIFETVVALNLLGFLTYQSCEGHLDHGCPYPWVAMVNTERSRRYYRDRTRLSELEVQAQQCGTEEAFFQYVSAETTLRIEKHQWVWEDELHSRVRELLNAFYTSQDEAAQHSPTRLYGNLQTPGICRIEPGSALHTQAMSEALKTSYLIRSQAEMQAFTRFLKRRWQERRVPHRPGTSSIVLSWPDQATDTSTRSCSPARS